MDQVSTAEQSTIGPTNIPIASKYCKFYVISVFGQLSGVSGLGNMIPHR
jgi:hypothetical protein